MPKEKSPTAFKKNSWGNPLHHPILTHLNQKGEPLWRREPCPLATQSQQLLSVLTPLLWKNISHNKPAPSWKIATSADKNYSYLYLSLANPLLSILDNHPWFRLQTFITEDAIWQGRLSRADRKAITLHTILNCPAPHFPHSIAPFSSLDAVIERLIAERNQQQKQDKLLKEFERKKPENKTFCWWETLPFEISALFMDLRNQLLVSQHNALFNEFFIPLQSTEKPKNTLGTLLCHGNNILLVIHNPKPTTIQAVCLNTARKYKLAYRFSPLALQQAKIDCSAFALPIPDEKESIALDPNTGHAKNHTHQVTLLTSPEQHRLITQLLAYCLSSPLCETPCKLISHPSTASLLIKHDTFAHPLAVDDNLLSLLHRRKSLQRILLNPESQPDISRFPTITLALPKLDNPHTLYPVEHIHFSITLYGSPTITKSLLIKTFASLEDLTLPDKQPNWVTCLHYWPEHLDEIKLHIPPNTTAYHDCVLVEELLPQLLFRHPICKKTRIQVPQGLESAWIITQHLLQQPRNIPTTCNTSQYPCYPSEKLSPHRHLLQNLLSQNPALRVTPLTSEPGSVLLTKHEQQTLANYQLPIPPETNKGLTQAESPPSPIFATEDWYHTPENSFSSVLTGDSDEVNLHDTSLSYECSLADDATWRSVPGLEEWLAIMANYFSQNSLVAEISPRHILSVTRSPSPNQTTNITGQHSFFVGQNHKPTPTKLVLQKKSSSCQ